MNTLSNDFGYRGVATAATIAAILLTTNWVRQLPSGSPLSRTLPRVLLSAATIAVIVAVAHPSWESPATLTATALTTSAVLLPTDRKRAFNVLSGMTSIGMGTWIVGVSVDFLRDGSALFGVVGIGVGAMWAIGGVVELQDGGLVPLGICGVGTGVAVISLGLVVYLGKDEPAGALIIGTGIVLLAVGVAIFLHDFTVLLVTSIGVGVALIACGLWPPLHGGRVLLGVITIGVGVMFIISGIAILRDNDVVERLVGIVQGVTLIGLGVVVARGGGLLAGVVGVGGGVALIGSAVVFLLRSCDFTPAVTWLTSLTKVPSAEAPHNDDSALSGHANPPPETRPPSPRPP